MQDYCRSCSAAGGCDACPRPQVLPCNTPAVAAYRLCETQWRPGFGCYTGLDYTACLATLAAYLPRWKAQSPPGDCIHRVEVPDLLDDVRVLEDALLTAWAEKAAAERTQEKPEQ